MQTALARPGTGVPPRGQGMNGRLAVVLIGGLVVAFMAVALYLAFSQRWRQSEQLVAPGLRHPRGIAVVRSDLLAVAEAGAPGRLSWVSTGESSRGTLVEGLPSEEGASGPVGPVAVAVAADMRPVRPDRRLRGAALRVAPLARRRQRLALGRREPARARPGRALGPVGARPRPGRADRPDRPRRRHDRACRPPRDAGGRDGRGPARPGRRPARDRARRRRHALRRAARRRHGRAADARRRAGAGRRRPRPADRGRRRAGRRTCSSSSRAPTSGPAA